jgi:hypothetical protein
MAVNLFANMRPDDELHPSFLQVRDDPRNGPAREMLHQVTSTLDDPDGNLVEQFQTTGFDARTFEVYLYALLRSEGHAIDRTHDRPDFLIERDGIKVAVEAVTSNPASSSTYQPYQAFGTPPAADMAGIIHHLTNEVQIRMGSPIYTKLKKRYWDLPHVRGLPFVIAFQPFHAAGSLALSSTALANLLMGIEHTHRYERGELVVEAHSIAEHRGSKSIPSNFFKSEGAEHISGILFCNAGTIPKFNRLGQQAGYAPGMVRLIRHGACLDHDPNSAVHDIFAYEVAARNSPVEPWRDGAVMIHNPHAAIPLPEGWFGAMCEEALGENGTVITTKRDRLLPFRSLTSVAQGNASDELIQYNINLALARLRQEQQLSPGWLP